MSSNDLTRALLGLPENRDPTDGEVDQNQPVVPTWIVLKRLALDRRIALLAGLSAIGVALVGGMPIYDVISGLPFPLDADTMGDLLLIAVLAGVMLGCGVASLAAYFVASRRMAQYRAIAPRMQEEDPLLEGSEEEE